MTKISKKSAYPVKIPVRKDYFVGTDSENNLKTVNFDFESTAKLINELNGTPILNYIFKTDNNIPLAVLTEGVFLSEGNETTVSNINKLYINKKNFHEEDMSDLFRFIAVNREVFIMKLRNSSNLANGVYFKITDATEFQNHFVLDVAIELSNTAVPELVNFNVYFFDFELSSSDLAITLPEFNKIVTQTGYTSTETTITFNPAWTWLIKNVSYESSTSVVKTITPTSAGKKRIDSFVLNTSGTFQVVTGAETIGSPIQELTPIDTLYVTFCIVGDAGIESIEPIDLSNYATIDYVDAQDTLLSNRITELENADGGVGLPIAITDVTGLTAELAGKVTQTEIDSLGTQLLGGAPADANTLKELNDKILAVQAIIGGTTTDGDALVNTVAELLAVFATFPEGVDLVTLLAGKVNTSDVYNALDCIVAGKVADARQLKVLNDLIIALTTVVSGKEDTTNKSNDIEADKTSTTKYSSVKQLYDWAVAKFQAVLVSGTNIKTINGTSILGSGDIAISGGGGGVSSIRGFMGNISPTANETVPSLSENWIGIGENITTSGGTFSGPPHVPSQVFEKTSNIQKIFFKFQRDGALGGFIFRLYAFSQADLATTVVDSRKIFEYTFNDATAYKTSVKSFTAASFLSTSVVEGERLVGTIQLSSATGVQIRNFSVMLTY